MSLFLPLIPSQLPLPALEDLTHKECPILIIYLLLSNFILKYTYSVAQFLPLSAAVHFTPQVVCLLELPHQDVLCVQTYGTFLDSRKALEREDCFKNKTAGY